VLLGRFSHHGLGEGHRLTNLQVRLHLQAQDAILSGDLRELEHGARPLEGLIVGDRPASLVEVVKVIAPVFDELL